MTPYQIISFICISLLAVEIVLIIRLLLKFNIPGGFLVIVVYWFLYVIYVIIRLYLFFNDVNKSISGRLQTLLFAIMTYLFYKAIKRHSHKRII